MMTIFRHRLSIIQSAALLVVVVFSASPQHAAAAEGVRLRSAITVEGSIVTLGDILENLDMHQSAWVADAPAPNRSRTISLSHIIAVAHGHGLTFQIRRGLTNVTVKRAGKRIPRDLIEAAILDALVIFAPEAELKLKLSNPDLAFHVPIDAPLSVVVDDVQFDNVTGRFYATLLSQGTGGKSDRLRISGVAHQMVSVPVFTTNMRRGAVVDASDLEWLEIPRRKLNRMIILDESDLIGKEVRRNLRSQVPVRISDIRKAVIIQKGQLVSITYNAPGVRLTAVAKALNSGSLGDVIQLKNTQSGTVVQGIVQSSNSVNVRLLPAQELTALLR